MEEVEEGHHQDLRKERNRNKRESTCIDEK
jgi:hypothetical protein